MGAIMMNPTAGIPDRRRMNSPDHDSQDSRAAPGWFSAKSEQRRTMNAAAATEVSTTTNPLVRLSRQVPASGSHEAGGYSSHHSCPELERKPPASQAAHEQADHDRQLEARERAD
ncbi:MAG: hypothetical protein R2855_07710 [Thermomicrobiales bacterium]